MRKRKEFDDQHPYLKGLIEVKDELGFGIYAERNLDFNEYMSALSKTYKEYFEKSQLTSTLNLKTFILDQKKMSESEKKHVFELHNKAFEYDTYGKLLT